MRKGKLNMEICKGSRRYPHDEIVCEGDCPCCMLIDEKSGLEKEISKLNEEIAKLNSEK